MIRFLIPGALLCFLLYGCGEARRSSPPPVTQVHRSSLSSTPLFLFKEVQSCRNKSDWESNDFALYLFIGGERKIRFKNFYGLINENIVRNADLSVVSDSHYGESVEYLFENREIKIKQEAKSKDVDLCPDVMDYGMNTVEGAALNATYFINKTYDKFTSATQQFLLPVTLKIGPKIAQTFVDGKSRKTLYLTDNAYYQPSARTVTFLPPSLEARMAGFHMNFWEIPMVPSHEYAHHIFHTIFPYTIKKEERLELCYPRMAAIKSSERKIAVEDVLHAYNEGFADLVAFYTLDPSERDLTGVKCMQDTRDVASSRFINGNLKIFSQEGLKKFFSNNSSSVPKNCEDVDYQDIHIIGAIFAHNADRFLSTLTDSTELKLQVLREWVRAIKIRHSKLSTLTPERYFEEVFQIFLRLSLRKFDRKFDRSSCDEVNLFYPGLLGRLVECS